MTEQQPFFTRLRSAFRGEERKDKEVQKPPTPEQLQTLHRMREVLLTEGHPMRQHLDLTVNWHERMAYEEPKAQVQLVNQLYQAVAGTPEIDFCQDFPAIARRFEDSFPPQSDTEDMSKIPDYTLNPLQRLDKYITEYLVDQLPEAPQVNQVTEHAPLLPEPSQG